MIENLQGRRGTITRLKAELRLLTARRSLPIPYELLELIFQYFVHLHGQLPERLLLVCRTFYVVTINCRALWTDLDPVGRSTVHHLPRWAGTFIQSRVARFEPIPLTVDFTIELFDLGDVTARNCCSFVCMSTGDLYTSNIKLNPRLFTRKVEPVTITREQGRVPSIRDNNQVA